ncbi:MAG: MFS transporter [Deltaproteobacteria bacterium]|nr:MFS transporter [Deltaproteobacteria bacterium]
MSDDPSQPDAIDATILERRRTFDSLSDESFRWFFIASLAVFGATNSLILVRGYLVFELTGSYAALGSLGLVGVVPGIFATLYGGVIADRWPKFRVVQIGQGLMACFALGVGMLLYFDRLEYWHLLVSAFAQGGIFGMLAPSWQSIIPEIVGPRRLMNATALNMGGMNITRLVMPAACGFALGVTGAENVYFAITGTSVISVLALARAHTTAERARGDAAEIAVGGEVHERSKAPSSLRLMLEGWRYVVAHPVIWMLLVSNVVFTFFSQPFIHMLPGFVKQVLGGGPEMLGTMMSVISLGALSSTLFIASMRARNRGRTVLLGNAALGVVLVGFAFSEAAWLTFPLLLVIGAGHSLRNSLSNVLSQTYVDDAYRGRVMSLVSMQMNAAQLGTFAIGLASQVVGPRWAFAGMGAALVLMSAWFTVWFSPMRRLQ